MSGVLLGLMSKFSYCGGSFRGTGTGKEDDNLWGIMGNCFGICVANSLTGIFLTATKVQKQEINRVLLVFFIGNSTVHI